MRLIEMTWQEVETLDRERLVAVLPFAAIEQHGPHLPIGTDSFITTGIAERLERRASDRILLAPTQQVGSSPHHMVFPGTMTLGSRTFLDVARDHAASLQRHGVRHLLLLNGHGGNRALLDVATQEIRLDFPALKVAHATYWTVASDAFGTIRQSAPGGMGHAGEMETSVMLALHPDLVRQDRAAPGGESLPSDFDHRDMLQPGKVGVFRYWNEWSKNGVLGDPTTATAEKGERFLAAAVDALLAVCDDLLSGKIL